MLELLSIDIALREKSVRERKYSGMDNLLLCEL